MPIGSMRLVIRAEWVVVRELSKKRRLPCAIFADSAPGRRDALRSDRLSAVPQKSCRGCERKRITGRSRAARGRAAHPNAGDPSPSDLGRNPRKRLARRSRSFPRSNRGKMELLKAVRVSRRQEQRKRLGPDLRRPRTARRRPEDSCDFPAAKRTVKLDIMSIIS